MRLHRDAKTKLIRSLPLFADCTRHEIAEVAAVADELIFPPGRVLAAENADGAEFVVIIDGSAAVRRGDTVIARLHAGEFLGEIALVTGQPRMASVVATSTVRALVIEGHAFLRLLAQAPGIREKVERAVADRTATAG
jgi:CRP/FNR family cyclic AMP-dependent transcriptional regulator